MNSDHRMSASHVAYSEYVLRFKSGPAVVLRKDGEKSGTATESFSDDRHGLTRDLNSNAVWDISDLCLTPCGVKTTRPTPLINVMFFLSLAFHLSIQPGQGIKW